MEIVPYNPFPIIIKTVVDNWQYYLIFTIVLALIIRSWIKEDYFPYKDKRGRK